MAFGEIGWNVYEMSHLLRNKETIQTVNLLKMGKILLHKKVLNAKSIYDHGHAES